VITGIAGFTEDTFGLRSEANTPTNLPFLMITRGKLAPLISPFESKPIISPLTLLPEYALTQAKIDILEEFPLLMQSRNTLAASSEVAAR
jgi:hypothetical protein